MGGENADVRAFPDPIRGREGGVVYLRRRASYFAFPLLSFLGQRLYEPVHLLVGKPQAGGDR